MHKLDVSEMCFQHELLTIKVTIARCSTEYCLAIYLFCIFGQNLLKNNSEKIYFFRKVAAPSQVLLGIAYIYLENRQKLVVHEHQDFRFAGKLNVLKKDG